jgi:hypothetical protein
MQMRVPFKLSEKVCMAASHSDPRLVLDGRGHEFMNGFVSGSGEQ